MANMRDKNKRLKAFGIPIEICVKYERMVGVKAGAKPTKQQANDITKLMIASLTLGVADVALSAKDYELVAKEVAKNENHR